MSAKFKLTPAEAGTPLWQKLVEHYQGELAEHRRRLEDPNMEERVRVSLCWRINEIKKLIALGEQDEQERAGRRP